MAKVAASRRAIAEVIASKLLSEPENLGKWIAAGAAYLLERGQADRAEQLVQDIASEIERQSGSVLATVESAHPLTDTVRDQLTALLKTKLGASEVNLSETVTPELLSGFVLSTPDYELNTTARDKLRRLRSVE